MTTISTREGLEDRIISVVPVVSKLSEATPALEWVDKEDQSWWFSVGGGAYNTVEQRARIEMVCDSGAKEVRSLALRSRSTVLTFYLSIYITKHHKDRPNIHLVRSPRRPSLPQMDHRRRLLDLRRVDSSSTTTKGRQGEGQGWRRGEEPSHRRRDGFLRLVLHSVRSRLLSSNPLSGSGSPLPPLSLSHAASSSSSSPTSSSARGTTTRNTAPRGSMPSLIAICGGTCLTS
jgi:hypothetical protein